MTLERLADEGVEVAAIGALVLVALEGGADPSMVAGLISGLAGFRRYQRSGSSNSSSSEIPRDPPGGRLRSGGPETEQ